MTFNTLLSLQRELLERLKYLEENGVIRKSKNQKIKEQLDFYYQKIHTTN